MLDDDDDDEASRPNQERCERTLVYITFLELRKYEIRNDSYRSYIIYIFNGI